MIKREEDEWDLQKCEDHDNVHRLLTKQYYYNPSYIDIKNYNKLKIEKKKSYILYSPDPKVHRKFIFLHTVDNASTIKSYNVEDYMTDLNAGNICLDKRDVLILNYHIGFSAYKGFGLFAHEKITELIVSRNRSKQVTLLLLEKNPVYYVEETKRNTSLLNKLKNEARIIYLGKDLEELAEPKLNNVVTNNNTANTNSESETVTSKGTSSESTTRDEI